MSTEVPAVHSAIRILEYLAKENPSPVASNTLVSELGLNRSTCYSILATLQRAGWVLKRDTRGGWTLGPSLLALTGVGDEAVQAVIDEEISELSRELGFVVFAAQQDGSGGYTVIAQSNPGRGVRVVVDVGDRFPFSAPALMHANYAWRPFSEFEAAAGRHTVEKFTDTTVVDLDALAAVFEEVRTRGFSASIRQFNLAQGGVAAPVFDRAGIPRLLIATLAFSSQIDESNVASIGVLVRDTAARITERTGGTAPASAVNLLH